MKESLADLLERGAARAEKNIRDGKYDEAREGSVKRHYPPHDVKLLPLAPGEPPLEIPARGKNPKGARVEQRVRISRDERYRQFAREFFFSGHNAEAAYKAVGYSSKIKHRAKHLNQVMNQPVVQDELARLGAVAREVLNAKVINVTEFWHEICQANIFDFVEQNEDGTVSVRNGIKESMTPGQQRAVKRIRVRRQIYRGKDGAETETIDTDVELWDRIAALRNVGEIQGLYRANSQDLADFASILANRLNDKEASLRRTFTETGDLLEG